MYIEKIIFPSLFLHFVVVLRLQWVLYIESQFNLLIFLINFQDAEKTVQARSEEYSTALHNFGRVGKY